MITIQIQENRAFDELAILEVKKYFCDDPVKKQTIQDQIEELSEQINIGIGYDKAKEIYTSEEYTKLYTINFELFVFFDKIKKEKRDALEADSMNYQRHLIKNKLQEKFFGGINSEIKLGYQSL